MKRKTSWEVCGVEVWESGRETICGDMTEGKALSKRGIGVSKVGRKSR